MTTSAQNTNALQGAIKRTVFLSEVEVICSIGLHDFEKAAKQRVLIDVEVRLDPNNEPNADNVADTLDYDLVRNTVIELQRPAIMIFRKQWHVRSLMRSGP